jgi:hypothetical protein
MPFCDVFAEVLNKDEMILAVGAHKVTVFFGAIIFLNKCLISFYSIAKP